MSTFDYSHLSHLCNGYLGDDIDVACPECGPGRNAPMNRKRKVLRVWMDDDFAGFKCARCGASGYALNDDTTATRVASTRRRSPRPAPEATARVKDILCRSMKIQGTPAERYLRVRGIQIPIPDCLMYTPRLLGPDRRNHRALVAKLQQIDGTVTAVQVLFLTDDGRKVDLKLQRMTFGPMGSGAVHLGEPDDAVGLAEGIETGLSARQIFKGPVWCSLGANRLKKVELPDTVKHVHIFVDNDIAGDEAAEEADKHFTGKGLAVAKHCPHENYGDWNDALREDEI